MRNKGTFLWYMRYFPFLLWSDAVIVGCSEWAQDGSEAAA